MRIAIVGGNNPERYEESISEVGNVEIRFHDGIPQRNNKKSMEILIKNADYVIIMQAACSHNSMRDAKAAAKKCHKTVYYSRTFGLSSLLRMLEKQLVSYTA